MEEATVFRARSRVKKAPNDAVDEGRRVSDSTAGQTWPPPLAPGPAKSPKIGRQAFTGRPVYPGSGERVETKPWTFAYQKI